MQFPTHSRIFAGALPPLPPMTHTAFSLMAPSKLRCCFIYVCA